MKISLLAGWLLLSFAVYLPAATLNSIQMKEVGGKISLSFSLNGATTHQAFTLTNPDRVVIDFANTKLGFNLNKLQINNKLVKKIRSGQPSAKTLRLVFEVTDAVKLRNNPGSKKVDANYAFSLELLANQLQLVTKPLNPKTVPSSPLPAATVKNTAVPIRNTRTKSLRDIVIVLDPGHGGHDPGAIGPRHAMEKHVTLAIAKKLKQIIDKQPGMRAYLTRNSDYYVGLRDRLHIARRYNGDVFISIHADAFINRQSNGASVFALSQGGATSEAARWLAAKENYSELGGVNLAELDDQNGLVRTVLIDLSQTATISASLHMGEKVLNKLNAITRLHNHKVEQARFMVLKSPDIPSILIETGFISNPYEEYNLSNPRYQLNLTQAIFNGLKSYFWDYPPHGTIIESLAASHLSIAKIG